jgi:hypothetical protein
MFLKALPDRMWELLVNLPELLGKAIVDQLPKAGNAIDKKAREILGPETHDFIHNVDDAVQDAARNASNWIGDQTGIRLFDR